MASRPLTSLDHGNEVLAITVGVVEEQDASRIFTLHKNLICQYSDYFREAFSASFEEGNDGHINLPDDWPESFEVVYGWLYSRRVEAADFYTNGLISPALFWVSVYILSDRLLIKEIQSIAFGRITEIFNDIVQVIPTARFITELFEYGSCNSILETYVIRHSAFWLTTSTDIDSLEWELALKADERFGVGVAVHIAKVVSKHYKGSNLHPCLELQFDDNTNLDLPDDDLHKSANGDKEISFFSYNRTPSVPSSKPAPSIAVFHS